MESKEAGLFSPGLLRGGASGQVTVGTLRREEPKQNGGGGAPLFLVEAGGATFGDDAAAPPLPQAWWVQRVGETTPPHVSLPPLRGLHMRVHPHANYICVNARTDTLLYR